MKNCNETIQRVAALPAYEVTKTCWIEELQSQAILGRHKKSGARFFLLSNEDNNKVFTVGFRTPPTNDKGIPHILEHSVLCGSRKFPVKEPFVELLKGSLNTFLNAFTYPDKTVYPVASCNDKDFQNLMDVYMDAVLHPNVLVNEKIFWQEGWHYELENPEEPLTINGVVYNEMKGAYSSPEEMLAAHQNHALFPDTCYGKDSGGDPDWIPQLTFEEFTDFHRKYYHPSNSYLYLYGDMDMAEKLAWLDEAYLKDYDRIDIDSAIDRQETFTEPVRESFYYPLTEEEDEDKKAYLSWSTVVGDDLDPRLYVAFQILDYALLNAPGAPLKQALLEAELGKDIFGGYNNGILQPSFSVISKEADPEREEEFVSVLKETLEKLVKEGIDPKAIEAGINYYEFRYREADYGYAPKGLIYGLWCFDSWLYEETDPLMHLEYGETFAWLRQQISEGYFENLIAAYLLENPHQAVVVALPKKGMGKEKDEAIKALLQEKKAGLSRTELEKLAEETKALRDYQEEEADPEALKKIPLLSREDITREVTPFVWEEERIREVPVLIHNYVTCGIGYLKLVLDTKSIADEDLPYLGLLSNVLGYMSTDRYDYRELFHEIFIQTGGISTGVNSYGDSQNPDAYRGAFEFTGKAFYDKMEVMVDLIEEMMFHTHLEDEKRLKEILSECKSRAQMALISSGNRAALTRAGAYGSEKIAFGEWTGGIAYYKFLEDLERHFEEKKEEIIRKLKEMCELLFVRENLTISLTAEEAGAEAGKESLKKFIEKMPAKSYPKAERHLVLGNRKEGFLSSSNVQYVVLCGNYKKAGYSYTGALQILRCILNYDYLWQELRVKGGAYGCGVTFHKSGESGFYSYRDPHLKKSLEAYRGIPAYLEAFDAEEREMTKYIIGTVSELDIPLTPSAKGSRSFAAYMTHASLEKLQNERNQILDAVPEDIRALAPVVKAILEGDQICVVGNTEKCKEEADVFYELKNLFD